MPNNSVIPSSSDLYTAVNAIKSLPEINGALNYIKKIRNDQNFDSNDSLIASGFLHPVEGLKNSLEWIRNNVNTAAGLPNINQQDESSIYQYGPNPEQQAQASLNLAGIMQTGAIPFAQKSSGGVLGTLIKYGVPETKYSKVHDLAQKNAALPVEQGGLGLPFNNTAIDRADAMGFNTKTPVYHGTNYDINAFSNNSLGSKTSASSAKSGHFFTDNPLTANAYHFVNYFDGIPEKYIINGDLGKRLSDSAPIQYKDILEKRINASYEGADIERKALLSDSEALIDRSTGYPEVNYSVLNNLIKKYAPDSINDVVTSKNIDHIRDKIIGTYRIMGDYDKAKMISDELISQRGGLISSLEAGESPNTIPVFLRGGKQNNAYGATTLDNISKNFKRSKADSLKINNIMDGGPISNHYIIKDPKNIRSVFAAFDPMKKNSTNILASILAGTALANEYMDKKR